MRAEAQRWSERSRERWERAIDETSGVLASFERDAGGDALELVELAACLGRHLRYDPCLPENSAWRAKLEAAFARVSREQLASAFRAEVVPQRWREDRDFLEQALDVAVESGTSGFAERDEAGRLFAELDGWRLALVVARVRAFGGVSPLELDALELALRTLAEELIENPSAFMDLGEDAEAELELQDPELELREPELAETRDLYLVVEARAFPAMSLPVQILDAARRHRSGPAQVHAWPKATPSMAAASADLEEDLLLSWSSPSGDLRADLLIPAAAARGEETPIQLRFQGEGCSSVALAEGAIVELYGIALRRGAGGFEAELGALRQARSTHRGPNLLVVMPGGVAEAWIEGPWDEPR